MRYKNYMCGKIRTSMAMLVCLTATWCPTTLYSAQITNETFLSGANGWGGTSDAGTGVWTFTGGVARVRFVDTTPFPIPDVGILSNRPGATSGAFTGNYDSAVITLIGFDFQAVEFLPSGFISLEWGGSTSIYQVGFSSDGLQTGVWYTFTAPITVETKSLWAVLNGSLDDFSAARQSVSNIAIRITRTGTTQRHYLIDNIFIANQPAMGSLMYSSGSIFRLRADYVQTNIIYHLEAAPDITGTWSQAQTFLPTNQPQWVDVTNSNSRQFWRVIRP
jgi:hypothetical protein